MGIQSGVENLPGLFSVTFVAMLAAVPAFGYAAARLPRRRLVPWVYLFFIANIAAFYALFTSGVAPAAVAAAFFVWVSVFNLFVVSVFWSFMADIYDTAQARRLYGFIAAGGTAGAIAGPAVTTLLAVPLGPVNLLLVSGAFLLAATACIVQLYNWGSAHLPTSSADRPVGGGLFDGVRLVLVSPYLMMICAYVVLYSVLSTFCLLYTSPSPRDISGSRMPSSA